MKEVYISIDHLELPETSICWEIGKGELNAVIGANKSGKTLLAKIICGQLYNYKGRVSKTIDFTDVSFSDYTADSSRFHYSDFYYQQRYNVFDMPDMQTIEEWLGYDANDEYKNILFNKVLPADILTKKIVQLSSGESRKVLILKNIFKPAKIYILDHPFTGLDANSVLILSDVFKMMARDYGKTVILLLNTVTTADIFHKVIHLNTSVDVPATYSSVRKDVFYKTPVMPFNIVFQINDKHLKVANEILIGNVSWTIRKGEKWLLKGANGSGKSTLMSLLYADNPVAYGLEITLFDKQRGTGESIWDIKSKIGFVSPEIQLFWDGAQSVKEIIRSGFSNTIVLSRKITEEEQQQYKTLLELFQLQAKEHALFASLSSGEKRIVMIVRALVNNPPVLILDEPFQGLDNDYFNLLYDFLSSYANGNRTVIQIAHLQHEVLPGINRVALIENNKLHIVT